jgi:abortive infection bacteriophage resistance protein
MAKPARSIPEQIELLVERGLPIPLPSHDDYEEQKAEYHAAVHLLIDNNYYRLSGYWRYFQVRPGLGDNRFTAAATVAHIKSTYIFDSDLRCILMEGLSILEVTFRSRLAYYMAVAMPVDCYLDASSYLDKQDRYANVLRDLLIADIDDELRRSKEKFVAHHVAKDEGVPIWAAVEVFSFGTLSKMYGLLDQHDVRTMVNKSFGLPTTAFTAAVFRSFVVLRNQCAHHSRLWHRVPEVPPPVLNKFKRAEPQLYQSASPWAWFVMVADLVDTIRKDASFSSRLWAHLNSRPDLIEGYQYPRHT